MQIKGSIVKQSTYIREMEVDVSITGGVKEFNIYADTFVVTLPLEEVKKVIADEKSYINYDTLADLVGKH